MFTATTCTFCVFEKKEKNYKLKDSINKPYFPPWWPCCKVPPSASVACEHIRVLRPGQKACYHTDRKTTHVPLCLSVLKVSINEDIIFTLSNFFMSILVVFNIR